MTLFAAVITLACAAGAAPAAMLTPLGGPTAVREYAGTALLSAYDRSDQTYRLATVRDGVLTPVPGVDPAGAAFDADIGPGADGRAQIVFSTTNDAGDRDLFVVSLPDGDVRPVRNANTDLDEVAPTLWRGRIAFVRLQPGDREPGVTGVQRDPIVYTKELTAPRARPSQRLPGVPQRRCGDFQSVCGPTTGRGVEELELFGSRLALSVRYECRGCVGIAQTEVRLDDLRTGRAEQVAFQPRGLAGQALTGLSFGGGRIAFYKSCGGETSGCIGRTGPRALTLASGRFEAARGPTRIGGFAYDGTRAFEVIGCSSDEVASGADQNSCNLEIEKVFFAPAPRPLRD